MDLLFSVPLKQHLASLFSIRYYCNKNSIKNICFSSNLSENRRHTRIINLGNAGKEHVFSSLSSSSGRAVNSSQRSSLFLEGPSSVVSILENKGKSGSPRVTLTRFSPGYSCKRNRGETKRKRNAHRRAGPKRNDRDFAITRSGTHWHRYVAI